MPKTFVTLTLDILFKILHTDSASQARQGRLETAHGIIDTPIFMPVGTQGTVKSVSPHELEDLGAQITWKYLSSFCKTRYRND